MNKKISLGAAIAFMVVVAGITFCITMMVSLNHFNTMVLNVKEREETYKKLAEVDRKSRQNYAGKIDEEYLSNAISAGYMKGLGDKYSSYLSKDEYEQALLDSSGRNVSIGVTVEKDATGYFLITAMSKESPAELAGMNVGDLMISIDNTDLKNVSKTNVERLLKGQVGTKITVVYRRKGVDTSKEMQRKDIDVSYVDYRKIDTNGYIKIKEFNDKTAIDFKVAIDSLIQQSATGLIIDIRNNNSSSFISANSILNTLLPAGNLGMKVDNKGNKTISAVSDPYEVTIPIVVLINAKTGNASEYFAACMRDFTKGNIVGVNSMGKCIIQELIPLTDGSAINLTTGYMLPPSGNDINAVGIKPEYEVKLTPEQEKDFSSLDDKTDPQILKAVEVINSKIVKK